MSKTIIPYDKTKGFNSEDWNKIVNEVRDLPNSLWEIEIRKPTRSNLQNKSLHLFCHQIAAELNGVGATCQSISVLDGKKVEEDWDTSLVKERIWRRTQMAKLGKKSTTALKTDELDIVAGPIIKLLCKKFGFGLLFPSQLSLQLEKDAKKLNK